MASKATLVYLVLLAFLPTFAISSSHNKKPFGLKYKKFTLYQYDIVNKTSFVVVKGEAGANFSSLTSPIGTTRILNDKLGLTQDPSSKVVGKNEVLLVTSSKDGYDHITTSIMKLHMEDGLVGTITTVGVFNTRKPSNLPVAGGTKAFMFVQGYINVSTAYFDGVIYIYKIILHLYWPPYAPYALKNY